MIRNKYLCLAFLAAAAASYACSNDSVTPVDIFCNEGYLRCNAANVEACTNGTWSIQENCADSNKICGSMLNGQAACVIPESTPCVSKCMDGVLTQCNDDGSSNTVSCSDMNQICGIDDSGLPACVEDTSLVFCSVDGKNMLPGDAVCNEKGDVVTCEDDGTVSSEPCSRGVCSSGICTPRNCDDIPDGKQICQNNLLMVCDDGLLKEAENACSGETPACRDGESACSAYKNCGNILHGTSGCFGNNIVTCNDGAITPVSDCVSEDKYCALDEKNGGQFICKIPIVTDCNFNGRLFRKGETVCDGNVLKTCSSNVNEQFDDGAECAAINPDTPICDIYMNSCRAEKKCGEDSSIDPGSIVCNFPQTNLSICRDGVRVEVTDDKACKDDAHGKAICIESESGAACSLNCEPGYILKDSTCIEKCDSQKEIYDIDTDSCFCDSSKQLTGIAGSCTCIPGYEDIDGVCTFACADDDMGYFNGHCFKPDAEFEIGTYTYNESVIPIEWIKTDVKDGTMMLVSKYILFEKKYHETFNTANTWENCTLRSWLNGLDENNNAAKIDYSKNNFIKSSFSPEEKELLLSVAVDKSNYSYEKETIDKVYILSDSEYVKYLNDKPSKWKDGSEGIVWVRAKGNYVEHSITIRNDGVHQTQASGYAFGIRPVIWVKFTPNPKI